MPVPISKVCQYYPSVSLTELTDLYSAGNNLLAGKKVCVLSYLPKNLRFLDGLTFTNKYVFLAEGTTEVDSIAWTYKLYRKGQWINDTTFLEEKGAGSCEYTLSFPNSLFESNGSFRFDKLKLLCTVRKGTQELKLGIEHNLIKGLDARRTGLTSGTQSMAFSGSPGTTNYLLNHLKEYFPLGSVMWNGQTVEMNTSAQDTLLKIVAAMGYNSVLAAPGTASALSSHIDIDAFTSSGLKAFINENKAYIGDYRNGLFQLPLSILNDSMTAPGQVPDYTNIPLTNEVYAMITDSAIIAYNNLESEFLFPVPARLVSSRQRLAGNMARLVELYQLSSFPKAAIKLTAILVRFLFECSKKNQCRECLYKQPSWPTLALDQLKDNPDFLRNILTHYFYAPCYFIQSFYSNAVKCTRLVWSPGIYTLLRMQPRIVKAYFARKVVRQIDGTEYVFDFERIDNSMVRVDANGNPLNTTPVYDANGNAVAGQPAYDGILGRDIFLVVETLHARGKSLTLGIKPSDTYFTNQATPQPLEVKVGNNFVTSFTAQVGDFSALNTNTNMQPGTARTLEYLKIDHIDKAIVKVGLRSQTRATFDAWSSGNTSGVTGLRGNTTNLELTVQQTDGSQAYFGNTGTARVQGTFLNAADEYDSSARFRLVNRIVYEIYHQANPFNFLSMDGTARRKMGQIKNNFTFTIADTDTANLNFRKVAFFYHDQIDNEHFIAECILVRPRKIADLATQVKDANNVAVTSEEANVPAGWTPPAVAAPTGGDAYMNYHYPDGRIATRDNPDDTDKDYGIVVYSLASTDVNDVVDLVRMPNSLNLTFSVGNTSYKIKYDFFDTMRRFANMGCFGAFIGVLGETNLALESTGMCFGDGTSYPSISHPNGDSIDTRYLANQADEQRVLNAFLNWNFTWIIRGDLQNWLVGAHHHNTKHNDHLHSGNFNSATVDNIIPLT